MVESNMLITFNINGKRFYSIGNQLEYIEPNIIEKKTFNSKYEAMVAQYLNDNKINFITQFTFPNCKNKKCLRFDFCINIDDNNILIEYNGIQHYKPINFFGGNNSFEQLGMKFQVLDLIKKIYFFLSNEQLNPKGLVLELETLSRVEQRIINDNIKLNYTKNNDIPFIRIPYHIKKYKDIYNFLDNEIKKYRITL